MDGILFLFTRHILGSVQTMLQQATILQITGRPHKLRRLLISTAAIRLITVLTESFAPFLSSSNLYIWLSLLILSYRFIFKQPWMQSVFFGLGQLIYVQAFEIVSQIAFSAFDSLRFDPYSTFGFIILRLAAIVGLCMVYLVTRRTKANISIDFKEKWHYLLLIYLTFIFLFCMPIIISNEQNQLLLTSLEIYYTAIFLLFILVSSIYIRSLIKISNIAHQLEAQELYIETLNKYTDRLRVFKHDYDNMINTIGGLIDSEDFDGLKTFHKDLGLELLQANNLDFVNAQLKNIPLLRGVVMSKVSAAELYGIEFRLSVPRPIKLGYCNSVDFSRIMGILLDNAFEAAVESERKYIEFAVIQSKGINKIIVRNTCNEPVDVDLIFKKGYSTKQEHSGIGLYEIMEIVKKYQKKKTSMSIDAEYENQTLMITLTL